MRRPRILWLLAAWIAVSALLYLLCPIGLLGSVVYGPFLGIGLFMMAVTFATLLPFLILSAASRFFGERLKALLDVKPEAEQVPSAVSGVSGPDATRFRAARHAESRPITRQTR